MAAYHQLTAKNRNRLRNPTLGNRVWATFTFSPSDETELCLAMSSERLNAHAADAVEAKWHCTGLSLSEQKTRISCR